MSDKLNSPCISLMSDIPNLQKAYAHDSSSVEDDAQVFESAQNSKYKKSISAKKNLQNKKALELNMNMKLKDVMENFYKDSHILTIENPDKSQFLPEKSKRNLLKKTLILDLDETLIHSCYTQLSEYDYKLDIDNRTVYVRKRPYLNQFLKKMSDLYEMIVYTSSEANYAFSILKSIDICGSIDFLLTREYCVYYKGVFVKQIGKLGRPLSEVIVVDVSFFIN